MADALPGRPSPLGATPRDGGINFAVASGVAEAAEVCLFDEAGQETRFRLPDYDGGAWHGFVPVDTFDPAAAAAAPERRAGDQVTVEPRSVLVLRGPRISPVPESH